MTSLHAQAIDPSGFKPNRRNRSASSPRPCLAIGRPARRAAVPGRRRPGPRSPSRSPRSASRSASSSAASRRQSRPGRAARPGRRGRPAARPAGRRRSCRRRRPGRAARPGRWPALASPGSCPGGAAGVSRPVVGQGLPYLRRPRPGRRGQPAGGQPEGGVGCRRGRPGYAGPGRPRPGRRVRLAARPAGWRRAVAGFRPGRAARRRRQRPASRLARRGVSPGRPGPAGLRPEGPGRRARPAAGQLAGGVGVAGIGGVAVQRDGVAVQQPISGAVGEPGGVGGVADVAESGVPGAGGHAGGAAFAAGVLD